MRVTLDLSVVLAVEDFPNYLHTMGCHFQKYVAAREQVCKFVMVG